jgi:hypothetical protein
VPRDTAGKRICDERRATPHEEELAALLSRSEPVRPGQTVGEHRGEVAVDLRVRVGDPFEVAFADHADDEIVGGANGRGGGLAGEERHLANGRAGLNAPDPTLSDCHLGGAGLDQIHLPRIVAFGDDNRTGGEAARLELLEDLRDGVRR